MFARLLMLPSPFDQLSHEVAAVRQRRNRTASISRLNDPRHLRSALIHCFIGKLAHRLLHRNWVSDCLAASWRLRRQLL